MYSIISREGCLNLDREDLSGRSTAGIRTVTFARSENLIARTAKQKKKKTISADAAKI